MNNDNNMSFFNKIQYFLLNIFSHIMLFIGFYGVQILGNFGGFLMWIFLNQRRDMAIMNIQERLGYSKKEAERIAKASFMHNTRSFLEITLVKKFSYTPKNLIFEMSNKEIFEQMQKSSMPVVASTAHIGAWELLAALIGDLYKDKPRTIVVRRYPNPAVQKFIADCRESHGAHMVGHRTIVPNVLKTLKNKGIAAFLVDHNALSHEALYIPFLGKVAAVNMGPALLALRGEAMVYPLCLIRTKTGYSMEIEEPLNTATLEGTREEKIAVITKFYTQAVENWIKKYPEQWFWLHNRWKQVVLK